MIKVYSKSCENVFRMVSQISQEAYSHVFLAKDICLKAKVPEYSARKGLQLLVQHEILKAIPGPGGGYEFKAHPRKISLLTIVEIIDGAEAYQRCVMGLPRCNNKRPCPMHGTWKHLRAELINGLSEKTLFDLMKEDKK